MEMTVIQPDLSEHFVTATLSAMAHCCCMHSESCTQGKVGHQIWVKVKCASREAPTCVDAVLQPHALEVVVTPLLVLLERAALFVTPPTVSTLVGFSN